MIFLLVIFWLTPYFAVSQIQIYNTRYYLLLDERSAKFGEL